MGRKMLSGGWRRMPRRNRVCVCVGVCMHAKPLSHVRLFAAPQIVACQAPLSMGFSRQEYWSALPCPPPGDIPHPGIKPASHISPALAGGFFTTSTTWEAHINICKTEFFFKEDLYLLQTPYVSCLSIHTHTHGVTL